MRVIVWFSELDFGTHNARKPQIQIKCLLRNLYGFYAWSRSQECLDAYRWEIAARVRTWESLRAEGVSPAKCSAFTGILRATYYRRRARVERLRQGDIPPSKAPRKRNTPRWAEREQQLVLEIRRKNKTWGKAKIAVVLQRDHNVTISESTVGRILLFLSGKGLISRARSRPQKRRRDFSKGHAKPWKYKDYRDMELGERVQIDHMTATKNGVTVKHFQAWERKSKHIHAQIYSHAKSTSAKKFLKELIQVAPYQIRSIQVDGGSEFMADFEAKCERVQLTLDVLPPSKPTYNGEVERANRTFRQNFYDEARNPGRQNRSSARRPQKCSRKIQHIQTTFRIERKNPNGVHSNQSGKGRISLKIPKLIHH